MHVALPTWFVQGQTLAERSSKRHLGSDHRRRYVITAHTHRDDGHVHAKEDMREETVSSAPVRHGVMCCARIQEPHRNQRPSLGKAHTAATVCVQLLLDEAMFRLVDHQLQKVCHGSAHDHYRGGLKRLRAVDGQDQTLHAAAVWSLTR